MKSKLNIPILKTEYLKEGLIKDLISSVVVFLVAIPLCMGIAVASGTTPFNGLLAGIIGGIVVGLFSNSNISVSGPAAGLFVIVAAGITSLSGGYEAFLVAVFLSGAVQVALGLAKTGRFSKLVPPEVIRGLMVAIGIILLLKQIPHALGYNPDFEGDDRFVQQDGHNTFSEIYYSLKAYNIKAVIITLVTLAVIIVWNRLTKVAKVLSYFPASLVGLLVGILCNELIVFHDLHPAYADAILVELPVFDKTSDVMLHLNKPNFSAIGDVKVWVIAIQIALVGSVESLLSLEAADNIDPMKRKSSPNRELLAQGIGNMTAGLIGALPVTSVVVRSSVNANSGSVSKMSTIFHGFLILISILFFPFLLNKIPLSALAAVLIMAGFRLAKPSVIKQSWFNGIRYFVVFAGTVLGIVFTDVLFGVIIGLVIYILFLLWDKKKKGSKKGVE